MKFLLIGLTLLLPNIEANAYTVEEIRRAETPKERKIRNLRNQEVRQLRITLGRRMGKNRKADLYFRLAEIYLEAYRQAYFIEGRIHEAKLVKSRGTARMERTYSKPFLRKGLKACEDVLKYDLRYRKKDQVLYFMGFYYGELNQRKRSIKYYRRLVREFPRSALAGEAYRELGEYAYSQKNFAEAERALVLAVQKHPDISLPRVLHKLAWTYYKRKKYKPAIRTMKRAITLAQKNNEKFLSLKDEALRDMALFMAVQGDVESALSYFDEVAGDKEFYPRVLEKLGKNFERSVRPDKATLVYETILKTRPKSETAFRVLVKLVDLDLRRKKFDSAHARILKAKIFVGSNVETRVAAINLRAMVRRTATEHHDRYRKRKRRRDLKVADQFYTLYLDRFLRLEDLRNETPEIQMYLAEIKRERGQSRAASNLYKKVIQSKDPRYAKEAGVLWTASLAAAIQRESKKTRKKKRSTPSTLEKEFVEAADELTRNLGGLRESREAALKAAQLLAGYSETRDDAIERCEQITERWPSSKQALVAAQLWLQILDDRLPRSNNVKRWKNDDIERLADGMKKIRENQRLMSTDRRRNKRKLAKIMVALSRRIKVGRIAALEGEQDFGDAAEEYEKFAKQAKTRKEAETAYENAINAHVKADDLDDGERVAGVWLARYPSSKRAKSSLRQMATRALIDGEFEHAAKIFKKLGIEGSDPVSLETTARLYDGIGEEGDAEEILKMYLKRYKRTLNRWAVMSTLANLLVRRDKKKEALRYYEDCMAGPLSYMAECGARLADLYRELERREDAREVYQRVAYSKRLRKGALSAFVAYARFRLGEMQEEDARFVQLRFPEAQLKKGIAQRLAFLEKISQTYNSAVDAGGPWAVAALNRLARYAVGFANDVDRIPLPKKFSSKAKKKLRANLRQVSQPLRKKAIEAWSRAYSVAERGELLSPAVPEIADALADYRVRYPSRAQGGKTKGWLAGVAAKSDEKEMKRVRAQLRKNPKRASSWVNYGNLLWGDGKAGLARLAYERSLRLDQSNPSALNNRAVILMRESRGEDWVAANEASALFKKALAEDSRFLPSLLNRASLLNYYRLFKKSRKVWVGLVARKKTTEIYDGLAVAQLGVGQVSAAKRNFRRGTGRGGDSDRFALAYHEAALASVRKKSGAKRCSDRLDDISRGDLKGFEREAFDHLVQTCERWENGN